MAKTLANVRASVRDLLDEQTAADWTNAEIDTFMNERYHAVYTAVVNTFESYYSTTTTFATQADVQEYGTADGFPTDFYKLRRVEINYDTTQTSGAPLRALPINIDQVRRDLGFENLGVAIQRNPLYYLRGDNLGFIPIPDKSQSNAIKMWYVQTVADLTTDTEEFNIPYPDRYWKLIAHGAVADLLRFGQQDMTSAERFETLFDNGIEKMKEELEDRVAEESKFVIDVEGVSYDMIGSTY